MNDLQLRILGFVSKSNWMFFILGTLLAAVHMPVKFSLGILFGGFIVTINFHILARTLKHAFTPPGRPSVNAILTKYYIRFAISGLIIFVLISGAIVDPLGLLLGLSIVVASIVAATMIELTKLIFREAV